jgi:LPXTG-motif cell wall-anchored protein
VGRGPGAPPDMPAMADPWGVAGPGIPPLRAAPAVPEVPVMPPRGPLIGPRSALLPSTGEPNPGVVALALAALATSGFSLRRLGRKRH